VLLTRESSEKIRRRRSGEQKDPNEIKWRINAAERERENAK
jgi:hypothetical protein